MIETGTTCLQRSRVPPPPPDLLFLSSQQLLSLFHFFCFSHLVSCHSLNTQPHSGLRAFVLAGVLLPREWRGSFSLFPQVSVQMVPHQRHCPWEPIHNGGPHGFLPPLPQSTEGGAECALGTNSKTALCSLSLISAKIIPDPVCGKIPDYLMFLPFPLLQR